MNDAAKTTWRLPIIVGLICALVAAAYVMFIFSRAPANSHPVGGSGVVNSATSQPADAAANGADKTAGTAIGAAANTATSPAAGKSVRIGSFSTAIDYAPLIVARSKGWLQEELGVPAQNIEFTTFQTLPTINEAFAAGRLDVVFEAEVPAIVGRAAGIDLKITGVGATLTEGIVVRSALPVQSIAQLKGHSVAVLSGTAMHYGLLNLLNINGVDPAGVKLLNMVPPDAAAAFSSAQVDAWAIWPPWGEQQVLAKTGRFLKGGEAQVQSVIVMRAAFMRDDPAAEGVMRAVERAKQWLSANSAEGIKLVAHELQLPQNVVQAAWSKHNWGAHLNDQVRSDLEGKARFLFEQKMIQQPVDVAKMLVVYPVSTTATP